MTNSDVEFEAGIFCSELMVKFLSLAVLAARGRTVQRAERAYGR